ncbi:unnamed protein product, partial [Echinostoma caproni]|uniref:DUF632 domain-containing protein n=1 Tax=Echinostoma caproni TaxID=27848 RepID=A0A183B3V9_9TREM
ILTSSFVSGAAVPDSAESVHERYTAFDPDECDSFSDRWYTDDRDEDPHSYAWEEYFSDFVHKESRSYLDTIREEYERRQRSGTSRQSQTTRPGISSESADRAREDFLNRHQEALNKRTKFSASGIISDSSLSAFKQQWTVFESSTTEIRNASMIPWPPFCGSMCSSGDRALSAERRIETVLHFVHQKLDELRRLQIQWHPDRFASRIGKRLHADIKDCVMQRVNAISQLLNTAMDKLRGKD